MIVLSVLGSLNNVFASQGVTSGHMIHLSYYTGMTAVQEDHKKFVSKDWQDQEGQQDHIIQSGYSLDIYSFQV